MVSVDITSRPITANPSEVCIWLPCSKASAIGTIPKVMAQTVVSIGRSRSPAPIFAGAHGVDFPRLG